jgi:hypothetical protein
MGAPHKCPNGHWFEPDASGTIPCPKCAATADAQRGRSISEDEVLDILGPGSKTDRAKWVSADEAGEHDPSAAETSSGHSISDDEVLDFLGPSTTPPQLSVPKAAQHSLENQEHTHSLQRRKKVCPNCLSEISLSFGHCPRCGGPLEAATTKAF